MIYFNVSVEFKGRLVVPGVVAKDANEAREITKAKIMEKQTLGLMISDVVADAALIDEPDNLPDYDLYESDDSDFWAT
jgi:hypothetical protein